MISNCFLIQDLEILVKTVVDCLFNPLSWTNNKRCTHTLVINTFYTIFDITYMVLAVEQVIDTLEALYNQPVQDMYNVC